ncbi:MAG: hypothetical protein KKB20_13310 [Proteobacteria bacterium]|nr:hypothetical protein [Pseudomonadota bacterium]
MSGNESMRGPRHEIEIDLRYVGPPRITQGGYISGLLAMHLDTDTVEVSMRSPTPMNRKLMLDLGVPGRVRLYDGERLLNEARPAELDLEIPEPVTMEEARRSSLRHVTDMPYPYCFGCGSARGEDEGLHLRSGPVSGRNLVATDWVPTAGAAGAGAGEPVPLPITWAAMECPTARAMEIGDLKGPDELILLGRMTTRVEGLPRVGRPCFFMGWPLGREGRKISLAGTMHDESGRLLVMSKLLFITLKEGATYDDYQPGLG